MIGGGGGADEMRKKLTESKNRGEQIRKKQDNEKKIIPSQQPKNSPELINMLKAFQPMLSTVRPEPKASLQKLIESNVGVSSQKPVVANRNEILGAPSKSDLTPKQTTQSNQKNNESDNKHGEPKVTPTNVGASAHVSPDMLNTGKGRLKPVDQRAVPPKKEQSPHIVLPETTEELLERRMKERRSGVQGDDWDYMSGGYYKHKYDKYKEIYAKLKSSF